MKTPPLPMSLPLLNRAAQPDGWHDVRAPGGYEWWYFDAESDDRTTQVVAIFLHGFLFHPGYLRAHARFMRRPTRVEPPLPGQALCAYLIVYRHGKIWQQFLTQYPGESLRATPDGPTVAIGNNRITPTRLGLDLHLTGTPWKLTGRGPQLQTDQTLEAQLSFDRVHPHRPMNRIFLSQEMTGAEHHWVLADPRCNVKGAITCGGETIAFTGRGYHDHNYGTAPIGPGLKHWVWGRSLDDHGVTTFHYAVPQNQTLPNELHVVRADDSGVRELEPRCRIDWNKRNLTGLRYPAAIELQDLLHLHSPKLVDDAPFYMRAVYDNELGGKAFCEIAYPHRLRWPILGRMIEMSIDKRPLKK